MPKEAPEYQQIPQALIDLWLANPVTRSFVQCLEFKRLDSVDAAGSGKLVDSSNSDLTHATLHRELGHQDAYTELQQPAELLHFYNMILIPEPEEEEKPDE